ncbi:MAG: DEAD/DEAH box helicase [Bacteroidetes bacterium]|nr:DEAD/DEAH box helicase [Bacteroidota bacterium]
MIYRYSELIRTSKKLIIPWNSYINKLTYVSECEEICSESIEYSKNAATLISFSRTNQKIYSSASSSVSKDELNRVLTNRGFKRKLLPYQLNNVRRLVSLNSGATFSVPGSGKTTEALAFFAYKSEPKDTLFVIAPINAFSAWDKELQDCYEDDNLSLTQITSTKPILVKQILKSNKMFIVNYHKLDKIKEIIAEYLLGNPTIMFVDESHYIKTLTSNRTSAALSFSHLPKAKLIMSGTPLPNSVDDIIPQFNFIYPEILAYRETVVDQIRNVYVRTTRNQLGILQGRFIPVSIPFSDSARKIYRIFRNDVISNVNYQSAVEIQRIKRSVILILQLISNPILLLNRIQQIPRFPNELLQNIDSPKLDYTCEVARKFDAQNKKVIIWTSFRKNIDILAYRLKDINCRIIMGGVSPSERKEAIELFNNSNSCNVIIINPAAGSEGISLHYQCHHAIYIDRTFNAVHWLQSQDRIRRIGQEKEPVFEILFHQNTIDERIDLRLRDKVRVMQEVLDDYTINVEKEPIQYVDDEDNVESYDGFDIDFKDLKYVVDCFKDESL